MRTQNMCTCCAVASMQCEYLFLFSRNVAPVYALFNYCYNVIHALFVTYTRTQISIVFCFLYSRHFHIICFFSPIPARPVISSVFFVFFVFFTSLFCSAQFFCLPPHIVYHTALQLLDYLPQMHRCYYLLNKLFEGENSLLDDYEIITYWF